MLTELVDKHGQAVYRFCYVLTKHRADADDLYQDTFLRAAELRDRFDPDGNAKGFLLAIAHGLWMNKRRKRARRLRLAPQAELRLDLPRNEPSTPEQQAISNELRQTVQEAVDSLPDRIKLPLYMYYTADLSIGEIAAALRIPAGTVKSRLHQARQTLRKTLGGMTDEGSDGYFAQASSLSSH